MATVTLTRGSDTVSFPLQATTSGAPLVVRSIGKPNMNIYKNGNLNPRFLDTYSGLEQYTLSGKAFSYSDIISLADLIKSNSHGEPLFLDIDMPDYNRVQVVPAAGQDNALTIEYPAGYKEYMNIDLALTRVSQSAGDNEADEDVKQIASTPTAAGSGPIEIRGSGDTVALGSGVSVTRSVGRPESVIRKTSTERYPRHFDKFKSAADRFELSFEYVEDTVSKTNRIIDVFARKLGYEPIFLDFNGKYGLGEFPVIPDGSEALRHSRQAGYKSSGLIPSVNLRRVLDTTA